MQTIGSLRDDCKQIQTCIPTKFPSIQNIYFALMFSLKLQRLRWKPIGKTVLPMFFQLNSCGNLVTTSLLGSHLAAEPRLGGNLPHYIIP